MENLSTLIKTLSPGEEKLIRHFYKLREFGEYRKRVQLYDLIRDGKAKNETHLAQLIGCTNSDANFHNIKSRLKSDILCILLMQESSCKFNSQFAQAMFNCRRSILTGELLLSRGVYQEGIALLKKASKLAEKFELYAERIITEDALRNHYAGSNLVDELQTGTETIEKNYELLGHMMNSKKKFYQTIFPDAQSFEEGSPFAYSNERLLDELEKASESSDSSRIQFYTKLARFNLLNNRGEFAKAIVCAKELLELAGKDPIIMSSTNQAGIQLEIANMHLRTGEFAAAETHGHLASELFKPGLLNHMRACTIVFYAQIHQRKYPAAEISLNNVLASRCLKETSYEILRNRIQLVSAWFSFARGQYDAATNTLKLCVELTKEKGAWSYGYSLMESMLLIEKGAFDAALYKLDALRKAVGRTDKDAIANRTLLSITVLRQLARSNNDYEEVSNIAAKEIAQLGADSPGTSWDPTGFEIVPLDELIQSRVRISSKTN